MWESLLISLWMTMFGVQQFSNHYWDMNFMDILHGVQPMILLQSPAFVFFFKMKKLMICNFAVCLLPLCTHHVGKHLAMTQMVVGLIQSLWAQQPRASYLKQPWECLDTGDRRCLTGSFRICASKSKVVEKEPEFQNVRARGELRGHQFLFFILTWEIVEPKQA